MRNIRVISLVLIFFVFLVFSSLVRGQLFQFGNPWIEKQAPEFRLPTTKGRTVSLTQFRNRQKAILFFWATWCPHCRTQLKELSTLAKEFENKGIKIVLIDTGEPKKLVQKYLDINDIPFETLLDLQAVVAMEYEVVGVPTFYFIDDKGTIKAVKHSLSKNFEELFE